MMPETGDCRLGAAGRGPEDAARTRRTSRRTPRTVVGVRQIATAFTLIEVLISIIILALGLLGIGVVFPVVIRQQRISTDEVNGALMARNVADAFLVRVGDDAMWSQWRQQLRGGSATPPAPYAQGVWQLPWFDSANGELRIAPMNSSGRPFINPNVQPRFEMKSRVDGGYVWDFAVQPVYDGEPAIADASDDPLRIAVFVRRIDARTRDGGLAVAVESQTGLPTVDRRSDQTGIEYARPIVLDARIEIGPDGTVDRKHLTWRSVNLSDENWAIVSQAGQKLVDSFGNVYTVQRGFIDEDDGVQKVRVEPPISSAVTHGMVNGPRFTVSIVTTPQPAAAVYVFEVTP